MTHHGLPTSDPEQCRFNTIKFNTCYYLFSVQYKNHDKNSVQIVPAGFNPPVGPIRTCTSRANKVTQCRYPLSGDIDTSFKSQLPRCAADQAPEVFPGSRFQGRRLPTRSAPATAKLLRPSPACSARRADPIFSSKLKEPPQWPGLVARQQSTL